jgi:sulfatase maturation enzyme AslB (radical SAM superfamily)
MTINLDNTIGQNFCYAPWTNIHINTEGAFKTCCAGDSFIADLRVTPISEIINSKLLLEIKQDIVNNQTHKNCAPCARKEEMTSNSERRWYNDIAENKTIAIESLEQQRLQNLDIRWSNTCNLSCVYCGPAASSQWAAHKKIPIERLDYSNTMAGILELIESNKGTLKNLGLLGGEPLLQKENEQLLDVIGADVHINLITNLTVPLENNRIFKKLLEKNNVVWDISFETIGEKFDYVRHGSTWETMLKNIRYLQDAVKDKPRHIVGTTGVYSVYNALNLSEVHQYFAENNLPQFRWTELHYPEILSVSTLPEKFRLRAADECEKSIQYMTWHRQKTWLQEMANSLRNITGTKDNCQDLYDWHVTQENTYWPDFKYRFADLWPEYQC